MKSREAFRGAGDTGPGANRSNKCADYESELRFKPNIDFSSMLNDLD